MVDGIKGSREVQKAETRDLLCADSIYEMIVDVEQSGFSGIVLAVGRLVRVKEIVSRAVRG